MAKANTSILFRILSLKMLAVIMMVLLLSNHALAQQPADKANGWEFGASIYMWFPDLNGKTSFSPPGSDSEFEVDIEDILENLEFALMGSFDVRKGAWGVFTDLIYMDVGNSASSSMDGSIGPGQLPTNVTAVVDFNMESWIWNLTGYYRALNMKGTTLDVVAGTRYLDVEQNVKWDITAIVDGDVPVAEQTGQVEVGVSNWDVIFGFRGRIGLGAKKALFIPYYLDVGVGDSDLTWQGVAGLGYAFGWGEIAAVWRYLYYDMSSGSAIDEISFSGPEAGVMFRW